MNSCVQRDIYQTGHEADIMLRHSSAVHRQKAIKCLQISTKTKKILFAVEIIVLLLFIGGLYVYGQLNSKLDKINQPVLDDSKIKVNQEVQDSIDSQESTLTGYTTYALFGIDHRDKNTDSAVRTVIQLLLQA